MDTRTKIVDAEQAVKVASRLRAGGRKLVLASGYFDVLQASHVRFLAGLAAADTAVMAAVLSDAVWRARGRAGPAVGQQARARLVAGLSAVDCVVIWEQPDIAGLVALVQPDRIASAVPEERNIIGEVLDRYERNGRL